MASSVQVQSHKAMKRLESRKSHSWWWDSHISPKNSKWLAENLEEMDRSVKRMLKLIEEDGDSFAKKAEMYYQKRPVLISLVEEFYRMYRSLAERYDHVTGELRKNIPTDLQSQGSNVSDIASEVPSTCPSPGPESKPSRRKSGPRAAGFDFFLGSGGSSSDLQKGDDESSTLTDSEEESDDSSVNNYSVLLGTGDHQSSRKIMELEIEIRDLKEKLRMQQDEAADDSSRAARNENSVYLAKIEGYEQELKVAHERAQQSQEEISRLNSYLQKYKSLEFNDGLQAQSVAPREKDFVSGETGTENDAETQLPERVTASEPETSDSILKIQALTEELSNTKERLKESETEIASLRHQIETGIPSDKISSLQDQLALAQKDVHTWKTKLNAEKREVSKLQERISRLKSSLSDRDHEVRDLKIAVSDAEQKIFPEKAQIKAEISKLSEERKHLEEQLRESESRGRSLEDEIRMLQAEKIEVEESLKSEITKLKVDLNERDRMLDALKSEKDELNKNIATLHKEVISRDDRIDQMEKHLHQLHLEHVELISGAQEARKLAGELQSKAKDLEEEVEKQKIAIAEGAEEKREVIRQLCFSLEHYRNGYHRLRQAFVGQRRVPVLAS